MATEGDAASRVSLPTLTVLYATETGNAEEVAERVSQLALPYVATFLYACIA